MFIRSIGVSLPKKKVTVKGNALAKKLYFEETKQASYFIAAKNDTPSSLAISAAEKALRSAGSKPSDCVAVIYAQSFLKDFQCWSAAASICNELGFKNSSFIDISQGCTGGIAALENIERTNPFDKTNDIAIFATSGILPKKLGDHFTIDRGGIASDGAVAIALSAKSGRYEVLAVDMKYDASCNDFIKMPYGGHEFARRGAKVGKFDILKIKNDFVKGRDERKVLEAFTKIKNDSIFDTLRNVGLFPKDISFVITPNYCHLYNSHVLEIFDHLPRNAFSFDVGMEVSHTGAGDIFINLSRMEKRFKKGDLIALIQDGGGICAGCAILRVC